MKVHLDQVNCLVLDIYIFKLFDGFNVRQVVFVQEIIKGG